MKFPPNYQLSSPNKFKGLDILLKTNNLTHTTGTYFLSQENQEYYNYLDQQYIACKYNGGLEQVTLGLVPHVILEEEEEITPVG